MFNKPEFARATPTVLETTRTDDGRIIIGVEGDDLITLPSFANDNQPFKGMFTFLCNQFGDKKKNGI